MLYEQLYGDVYYEVYGNVFALELLISLIPFVIYQPRRNYFELRACLSFSGYLALVNVAWLITRKLSAVFPYITAIYFFLSTLFLGLGVYAAFKTDFFSSLYLVTGAYALQHASYAVGNIIKFFLKPQWHIVVESIVFDFILFVFIGALFFVCFIYPRRNKLTKIKKDIRIFLLSFITLVICVTLSLAIDTLFAEFIADGLDVRDMRVYCSLYAIIGCFFSISMQFGYMRENKLSEDNEILDQLLVSEKKHHELSKETIDIINVKCHDLKHQIARLEHMDDKDDRKAYIREIEDSVAIYDSSVHTGNDALDIVIAEKSLFCQSNKIAFSCLVDGEKLAFMNSVDVAVLFGNAFDNAIERELKEEVEARFISLSVKEDKGFIYVHMDNYCTQSPEFENGLPLTTKEDKNYHGFGTKSIKTVVSKYSGELFMGVQDDRFNFDILFPAH